MISMTKATASFIIGTSQGRAFRFDTKEEFELLMKRYNFYVPFAETFDPKRHLLFEDEHNLLIMPMRSIVVHELIMRKEIKW